MSASVKSGETVHPAVQQAREAVGLYGDPAVEWGICVELEFGTPLLVTCFDGCLRELTASYPHLGPVPTVETAPDSRWAAALERVAARPFGDQDPLVRVLVSPDGCRLVVAAHHGACDGLGLLAIADAVTQRELTSLARGIGDRTSTLSFLRSCLARLQEATLTPPARFSGTACGSDAEGEELQARRLPRMRIDTADLAVAVAATFKNGEQTGRRRGRRRLLLMFGASRRVPGVLAPDRQTAYFRLPCDPSWSVDRVRSEIAALEPEPTSPETSAGGLGPAVARIFRSRLGATAMLSNLGAIQGRDLVSVSMYPAARGPQAVAIGLASTDQTTTVTLRTRRADFTEEEAAMLLDALARETAAGARAET